MRVRVPPAEQKEKDMQLKVFTAFSGYDSQCMALDRLGIGYDLVGWSEIDKYAIQAHNAVYPQYRDRNFGDICHIDCQKSPTSTCSHILSPARTFQRPESKRDWRKAAGHAAACYGNARKR